MTLLMLNSLIFTLFVSCISALSPISLGSTILCVALLMAINLAMMFSSWFGFIMFIIYVGGMLVMFAYFAALQPNQFITNWNWFTSPVIFVIVLTLLKKAQPIMWMPNTPSITQLFSLFNLFLPVVLALVLFLALIMVIKVSRAEEGPLRPFQSN